MSTLVINKKSLKTWLHTDSLLGSFIISKFYFNADGVNFQIVEQGQSKRVIYAVSDITIVDDTDGGAEYGPYGTITELSLQLEYMNYPAFFSDGQTPIPSLNDLTNVAISSVTDGQILAYDVSTNKWININAGSLSDVALSDLTDVSLGSPTNGQVLTFNSTSGKWENQNIPTSAVTSVNGDTGDVVLDGDNIDVTDPTTSTDGTLNDALANIYASGGTPDLQAVTDEGATTTKPIFTGNIEVTDVNGGDPILYGKYNSDDGICRVYFEDTKTGNTTDVRFSNPSENNIILFKDESGTVAFLSDITNAGYTVVSSNQTAVNDTNYTVVANATFTDPTPTEGKGYVVYVRNGTATIGGTGYAVGSLVFRVYHSGAWSTREYKSNLTLDTTPTDGSTNGVESNGVFDSLALKADKSTTRQIVRSKNNGTFGSHTGNTAETVLFTIPITGGEFEIGDWMDFMFQFERLVTGTNITVRFRAGTNGNTSDALISTLVLTSATLEAAIKRERFEFNTGNILKGVSSTFSASQSDIALIGAARTSTSLNPANNWNLTVTAALGSGSDTILCTGYQIGKTKTF